MRQRQRQRQRQGVAGQAPAGGLAQLGGVWGTWPDGCSRNEICIQPGHLQPSPARGYIGYSSAYVHMLQPLCYSISASSELCCMQRMLQSCIPHCWHMLSAFFLAAVFKMCVKAKSKQSQSKFVWPGSRGSWPPLFTLSLSLSSPLCLARSLYVVYRKTAHMAHGAQLRIFLSAHKVGQLYGSGRGRGRGRGRRSQRLLANCLKYQRAVTMDNGRTSRLAENHHRSSNQQKVPKHIYRLHNYSIVATLQYANRNRNRNRERCKQLSNVLHSIHLNCLYFFFHRFKFP